MIEGHRINSANLRRYSKRDIFEFLHPKTGKDAYYNALKKARRTMNTTAWISYFVDVALAAQQFAENLVEFSLKNDQKNIR